MFLQFNRLSRLAFFQILSKLLLVRSKEPPGAYRVTLFPSLWPSPHKSENYTRQRHLCSDPKGQQIFVSDPRSRDSKIRSLVSTLPEAHTVTGPSFHKKGYLSFFQLTTLDTHSADVYLNSHARPLTDFLIISDNIVHFSFYLA